jgi:hypothetical protein
MGRSGACGRIALATFLAVGVCVAEADSRMTPLITNY